MWCWKTPVYFAWLGEKPKKNSWIYQWCHKSAIVRGIDIFRSQKIQNPGVGIRGEHGYYSNAGMCVMGEIANPVAIITIECVPQWGGIGPRIRVEDLEIVCCKMAGDPLLTCPSLQGFNSIHFTGRDKSCPHVVRQPQWQTKALVWDGGHHPPYPTTLPQRHIWVVNKWLPCTGVIYLPPKYDAVVESLDRGGDDLHPTPAPWSVTEVVWQHGGNSCLFQ